MPPHVWTLCTGSWTSLEGINRSTPDFLISYESLVLLKAISLRKRDSLCPWANAVGGVGVFTIPLWSLWLWAWLSWLTWLRLLRHTVQSSGRWRAPTVDHCFPRVCPLKVTGEEMGEASGFSSTWLSLSRIPLWDRSSRGDCWVFLGSMEMSSRFCLHAEPGDIRVCYVSVVELCVWLAHA